jgi:hypothetical protein
MPIIERQDICLERWKVEKIIQYIGHSRIDVKSALAVATVAANCYRKGGFSATWQRPLTTTYRPCNLGYLVMVLP